MATLNKSFDEAVGTVLDSLGRSFVLKAEQRLALQYFVDMRTDALALLPTGFGKSLIYQLAPLVAQQMGFSPRPVVAVVSPLTALMDDQVKEATSLGISAAQLGPELERTIKSCRYQLLFGSPEAWLSPKWQNMLSTSVYWANLVGIVVDEVHLIYKW